MQTLQDLKDLFTSTVIKGSTKITKHAASKKGHKHQRKLSKGELNHQIYINSNLSKFNN